MESHTQLDAAAPVADSFPVSFAQERIWFLEQLEPDSAAFTITAVMDVAGELDVPALEAALDDLGRRHEVLRTSFVLAGDAPAQMVAPELAIPLHVIDLRVLDPAIAETVSEEIVAAQATASFDLRRAPLMRARLILPAPGRGLLLLALHHVVCDGWSADLLIRDLAELYRARRQGNRPVLPDLPIQYADFAVWQRQALAGHELDQQMEFWRQEIDGVPRALELPTDRPRPAAQDFSGALVSRLVPGALARDLLGLARAEHASPFMLLLAAYQLVLARRSGQPRFLVGTPVSGRARPEISDLLGCFINMLVLRADASGDPTLRELLSRVRRACLDAYANQDLPFEHLVEDLSPDRDLARAPLAQVLLAVQDGLSGPVEVDGIVLTPRPVSSGVASYDLTLDAELAAGGFRLRLQYATAMFDADTATAVLDDLVNVLTTMAADPDRRISRVPLSADPPDMAAGPAQHLTGGAWVDTADTADMDTTGTANATGPERDATVLAAIRRSLTGEPEPAAVRATGESWTRGRLLAEATAVAARLHAVTPAGEYGVAICVTDGPRQLASLLGVWAAGGAWLMLDADAPAAWRRDRLAAAPVDVLLTDRSGHAADGLPERLHVIEYPVPASGGAPGVIDHDQGAATALDHDPYPRATAQLIGTPSADGSAGFLALPQLAYTAAVRGLIGALHLTAADTLAISTDLSDGITAAEPLAALAAGADVVLVPADTAGDATALGRLLDETGVTTMRASAQTWQALRGIGWRPPAGFRAVCAEPPAPSLAQDLLAAGARVIVLTGPADHTAWLTADELTAGGRTADGSAHPGPVTTLPGTGFTAVDFCGAPALPGALGRLWLGGPAEPRGYVGHAAATAAEFLPAPQGRRLRRTADLVRRPRDGAPRLDSRVDQLLAAHGRLIDPAEVERALTAHPEVTAAAVVRVGERAAADELVACHAPGTAEPDELTAHLRALLPAWALPDRFEPVESIPITTAGQVDRVALAAVRARPVSTGPAVRPRTHLERALLDCFSTALGRHDIGVHDDFFEAGGTSLTAARLMTALPEAVGHPVPLKLLFQESTVAGLAAALESPDGPGGRESAVQLALREEQLPDHIAPDLAAPRRAQALGRVLLTGATGFLGPHLTAELLAAGAGEVICLVRGEDPDDRLTANLRRFDLDVDRERITVLPGDLTLPRFGLGEDEFAALADGVDAIYHCGAVMNFVLPYRALRAPNVYGTREILRLACLGRPSAVHYVSTIDMRVGDILPEAAGPLDVGTPDGYVLSKKTGEHLVLEAGRRGLPVGVYRPWLITGATTTGGVGVRDQLALCLAGSLIAGVMPADTPLPLHVLPVDLVSAAIIRLSLAAPRPNPVHQFYNPQVAPMESVHACLDSTGYPLRTAPFEEWRVQLARRTAGRLEGLAALLSIDAPANGDPDVVEIGNTLSGLAGDTGFPPIDVEYVHKTVAFLVREGLVPPLPTTPAVQEAVAG